MSKEWRLVAIWGSAIGGLLAVDALVNTRHDGLTLSESNRFLLSKIPYGNQLFSVGLPYFCAWYWKHIVLHKGNTISH